MNVENNFQIGVQFSYTQTYSYQGAILPLLSFLQTTYSSSVLLPVSLFIVYHGRVHLQDSGMSNTAHICTCDESPLFFHFRSLALFKSEHRVSIFLPEL